MPIRNESELYAPVKRFWEERGYEVKGEVRHCDLVAFQEGQEPIIVELKRTFNLPLLIQGIDRLRESAHVYLAVELPVTGKAPHGLRWADLERLCRRLGFGLLTVRFYKTRRPAVSLVCEPPAADAGAAPKVPGRRSRKEKLLREFRERSGDYNVGGTTRLKRVTAYREKALQLAWLLRAQGPLSPARLRELSGHAKTPSMLRDNVYGWFARIRRGVYALAEPGEQALHDYAEVLIAFERSVRVMGLQSRLGAGPDAGGVYGSNVTAASGIDPGRFDIDADANPAAKFGSDAYPDADDNAQTVSNPGSCDDAYADAQLHAGVAAHAVSEFRNGKNSR